MVKAIWNGAVLADSDDTIIVEGNHYFPFDSVSREFLVESDTTTTCGWKGTASYFHVQVAGKTNQDAAWYYPHPKPEAAEIQDHIAFWKGVQIVDSTNS